MDLVKEYGITIIVSQIKPIRKSSGNIEKRSMVILKSSENALSASFLTVLSKQTVTVAVILA